MRFQLLQRSKKKLVECRARADQVEGAVGGAEDSKEDMAE